MFSIKKELLIKVVLVLFIIYSCIIIIYMIL